MWKSFTWAKTAAGGAATTVVRSTRNSEGRRAMTTTSPTTIRTSTRRSRISEPPAMAPMISKGSAPVTTASGSGASGDSLDRSSWQA